MTFDVGIWIPDANDGDRCKANFAGVANDTSIAEGEPSAKLDDGDSDEVIVVWDDVTMGILIVVSRGMGQTNVDGMVTSFWIEK